MHQPRFEVEAINLDAHVVHDGARTVAIVSPHGYVDWLLPSPGAPGARLRRIEKETHLAWVLGTKFNLTFCALTEQIDRIDFEPFDQQRRLLITCQSRTPDGALAATHRAILEIDEVTGRYRWGLEAVLRNVSGRTVTLASAFPIEYTNVLPTGCGRCMLFAPHKRFDRTLLLDADGAVWHFPHQHSMHYGHKLKALRFARNAVGGFFGEDLNPVVIVHDSTLPPDWGICDMFFDLHCGMRPPTPDLAADAVHAVRCSIAYWDRPQADRFERGARHVPVTADDYRKWQEPRLELGRNDFTGHVRIDDVDDASGFRQAPPRKVWDRETGPKGRGSLRITNATPGETVWSATPPSQIPANHRFRLAALARIKGVKGKGLFLRIRYHSYEWRPTPHFEWEQTLMSEPLAGDTGDEWVRIETPELVVPADRQDRFVWLDIVLDGQGEAWITDMDVDLRGAEADVPEQ